MENKNYRGNSYPDPLASSEEKASPEYGLKVARLIESEWFNEGMIQDDSNYMQRRWWIEKMRLYSLGKQDLSYYQGLISRQDEDLNWLNLDWRPDNTGGKYVNLVANGISDKNYRLTVTATDKTSSDKKQKYQQDIEKEMVSKTMNQNSKDHLGVDIGVMGFIPEDKEELELHMLLDYNSNEEIAEELLVEFVFDSNEWHNIIEQCNLDLVRCGISVIECYTHPTTGITLSYVDIENYIHSYVTRNDFNDKYYDGVIRSVTISELRRESQFTDDQLLKVIKLYATKNGLSKYSQIRSLRNIDIEAYLEFRVDVMNYTFKTSKKIVYKKKKNGKGDFKLSKKDSMFNSPNTLKFETVSKVMDTWYEGSFIIGSDIVYNWRESENVVEDKLNRAKSRFITRATGIYKNELQSFLGDIIPTIDQIHITKLKLQHVIAEIKPSGAEIDLDMLANLSGGDKVDYKEIIGIFAAKGIVFKKRITDEFGMVKEGRAVEELNGGVPANLLHLLQILRYQQDYLREVTGINPSRDGTQRYDALVGVNNAQLIASNTITEHIVRASKYMKLETAEVISLRASDIFRFKEAKHLKEIFVSAIGKINMDLIENIGSHHLNEFGYDMEMLPTQDEMGRFEDSLKIALQKGAIDEDDAFQAREIAKTNPKNANRYLKLRKKKRQKEAMAIKQQDAQIKSQADIASANAASENRIKEKQAEAQIEIEKQKALSVIEVQKTDALNNVNAPLRKQEFQVEVFKEQLRAGATMNLKKFDSEDKLKRQRENNENQSEMIDQRKKSSPPINFSGGDKLEDIIRQGGL